MATDSEPTNDRAQKPFQFGLKWLFLLPLAVGLLIVLFSIGLSADVLFILLALPVLVSLWIAFCRLASRFLSDL
jgi:hypothetical protein